MFKGAERFFVLPPALRRGRVSYQPPVFRSLDRAAFELRSELLFGQKKQVGDCGVEGDFARLEGRLGSWGSAPNIKGADLLTDVAPENSRAVCRESGMKRKRRQ